MNGASMNGGEPENGHAIGKKPNNSAATKRVHLTIKDIVYEVDVPIKKGAFARLWLALVFGLVKAPGKGDCYFTVATTLSNCCLVQL
jgi:hypothetical protein